MEKEMEKTICYCYNVTKNDVVKAIKAGAKSFEEVQKATQLGTGCQECVEEARELVAELLAKETL